MAPPRMPEAVIGLDVGKLSHWACVATRDGEILLSAPVANREGDLDSLFGRLPKFLDDEFSSCHHNSQSRTRQNAYVELPGGSCG